MKLSSEGYNLYWFYLILFWEKKYGNNGSLSKIVRFWNQNLQGQNPAKNYCR